LQLGVEAYKQAQYEKAAQHFQLSLAADPEFQTARLYLATTMAQQCVPGVETASNDAYCNAAVSQFRFIVDRDPQNIAALKSVASVYFNMKKLDESMEYQRKVMDADPHDPEAPYLIGVMDWTQSYNRRIPTRGHAGLKPEDPFIANAGCWHLRQENLSIVEDGMKMLSAALALKPDYDDAMAYMNLLYRERADIQCGDQAAFDADSQSADKWVRLTMEVKQQKANAKPQAQQ
jgi:tetratricopeptide (TPR) repeat protein